VRPDVLVLRRGEDQIVGQIGDGRSRGLSFWLVELSFGHNFLMTYLVMLSLLVEPLHSTFCVVAID
jgi:hypothetical protein